MPRIQKTLPSDRADYSFGDLVYWHLFVYGTRPTGDPAARAGREWDAGAVCSLLGITDKTLRNWLSDRHLPDTIVSLEMELFGDSPRFDEARLELREALRRGRREKLRKSPETAPAEADPSNGTNAADPERAKAADQENSGNANQNGASAAPSEQNESGSPSAEGRSTALVVFNPNRDHGRASSGRGIGAIHLRWWSLASGSSHSTTPRQLRRFVVLGLVILFGVYAWSRPTVHTRSNDTKNAEAAAQPVPPTPSSTLPPEAAKQADASLPKPSPAPEIKPAAPPPVVEPPRAERPRAVDPKRSEQEARAAEEQRVARLAVQARQEAFDAELRKRDEEARRQDREADTETKAQQDREGAARQVAGVGYRLMENTSATGESLGLVLAETVSDCALACLRAGCDGFAFPSEPTTPKLRDCYRFKAPITYYAHGTFRAGKRIEEAAAAPKLADAGGGVATDAPSPLAQRVSPSTSMAQAVTPSASPAKPDDLTRCANGPVKVTGFRIICDKILTGGRTLGSAQLRYTVPNINVCAAKCRPIAGCSGFTFNAADPEGQHSWEIMGGAPGMNDGNGWVSGTR